MYKMMFSFRDMNNAVLSGVHAMPQKDLTSDGTGDFSNARNEYFQTVPSIPNTVSQNLQKKWYGNRDASQVVANRRIHEIGVGSMNASKGPMAFMNKNDKNTRIEAIARVRGGGCVVPPKVRNRGKASNGKNQSDVPIGKSITNVPVIRSQYKLAMIPTQKPPGKPYVPFHVRLV